jgi:hypothetical protein
VDVQHEWINVRPEFGHDKRNAMRHQTRDEVHVAAQTIELGHNDRRRPLGAAVAELASPLDRSRKLRPAVERVRALPVSTSLKTSSTR